MDSRIIKTKLDIIYKKRVVESRRIEGVEARIADYVSPGDYTMLSEWRPLAEGDRWDAGKTVFFRFRIDVPQTDDNIRAILHIDGMGLDGLLTLDGIPYAGADVNHSDIPLESGTMYKAELEAATWIRALHDPDYVDEQAWIKNLDLRLIDTRIEQTWYDLSFAYEASEAITDKRRRASLLQVIEDAMLRIDVTRDGDELIAGLTNSRSILRRGIEKIGADPNDLHVALTAHAHIDVAWLWPLRETVRKCSRTFSTVAGLMERYPDFFFSCSQPVLYEYTKEHYPRLYERVKKQVARGQWETTGGMWVESDCNITSGEALIRQSLYGLRFFREEFGTRPKVCWLPDVFGFPATLPQILAVCGYESFFTVKLHWQARNRFPHTLFWWRGIDGSQVLAHIPRLKSMYNSAMVPAELIAAEEAVDQLPSCETVLMPFGYGDGGGGPTEKMLEYAVRSREFPGLPSCRHTGADAFFEEIIEKNPDLPEWTGELYLETHRGTLTSQARTKRGNRMNELALRDAEILGWMAAAAGKPVALDSLEQAWRNLLTLQFHDILPGSSIGIVHRETEEEHRKIADTCRRVIDQACKAVSGQVKDAADIIVFNTLSWDRRDPITVSLPTNTEVIDLIDPEGRRFPAQRVRTDRENVEYVFVPAEIPCLGFVALRTAPTGAGPESPLQITERSLENELCRVELNDRGEILRFYDKTEGREVIDPEEPANRLHFYQDGPEGESAWNVHATFERREYTVDDGCRISIGETGPVRISLIVEKRFRDSRIVQEVRLCRGQRRLDFHTKVDWRERQVLLKAAFPVRILSDHATYEVQFGITNRSTYRNTSWDQEKFEVAAHRWVDLSEPGYGVSLLNDCKYGHDVKDNVMRISLLRGPENPDPEGDLGEHQFTYSLYPHAGDWAAAETVKRAAELNTRCLAAARAAQAGEAGVDATLPARLSFASLEGPAILDTVKPAEDGNGWIFRSYEPNGGRGRVLISFAQDLGAVEEVNAVEEHLGKTEPTDGCLEFELEPFRIKTFRCQFDEKQRR